MSDPAFDIQVALVTKLKALGTAAGTRVYDVVPKNAALPYITVGYADANPIDEECFNRTLTTTQIDVWSDAVGLPEVKKISGAIRMALHERETEIAVANHRVDRIRVLSTIAGRDPGGVLNRARMSVQFETEPA